MANYLIITSSKNVNDNKDKTVASKKYFLFYCNLAFTKGVTILNFPEKWVSGFTPPMLFPPAFDGVLFLSKE